VEVLVDIQSPTAEIRRGKKEEDRKKPQGKNIMACPISYGGHKNYNAYNYGYRLNVLQIKPGIQFQSLHMSGNTFGQC